MPRWSPRCPGVAAMFGGVELVIQRTEPTGDRICTAFGGLQLSSPALVVLADYGGGDSRQNQLELFDALLAEITGQMGGLGVGPPCVGVISTFHGCCARDDVACQKLLVVI